MLLKNLKQGRNTLVVEVSSLRSNSDLTHWRPAAFNGYGTGGWWNFGGILREVYVRRVDTVDVEDVQVLPRLRRVGGPAKVEVRTVLRNFTSRDRDVALLLRLGRPAHPARPRDGPGDRPARAHAPRSPSSARGCGRRATAELYDLSVGALTRPARSAAPTGPPSACARSTRARAG